MTRFLALWLTCWAALLPSTARAQTLLPDVNVAALASAGERLFVGGFDQGLFVVDAVGTARALPSAALSVHINALAWSEPEQVLWVGTARGLVRCRVERRADCRRVGSFGAVHALLLRERGELVAGGDGGLAFVRGENVRTLGKKHAPPFRAVWALAEADGKLYVGATNGLFWRGSAEFAPGAKWQRASVVQGTLPDDWITALLWHGGHLYVGTYREGVARLTPHGEELRPSGVTLALSHVNPAGLFALSEAELAVATMEGLWRGHGSRLRQRAHSADVTAVARFRTDDYWLGTRRGLTKM